MPLYKSFTRCVVSLKAIATRAANKATEEAAINAAAEEAAIAEAA